MPKSCSELSNLAVKSRPSKQSKVFNGGRAGMSTKVYQVHIQFQSHAAGSRRCIRIRVSSLVSHLQEDVEDYSEA